MARGERKAAATGASHPDDRVELARRWPERALAVIVSPGELETWPEDAVAALLAAATPDHPIATWSESKPVSLWRIARSLAAPHPRDWANDLLVALAAVGSRLEAPWPTTSTDLLGAPFHVHHRHATAEQLAWLDPADLTWEQLKLLRKHPNADAWVVASVDGEIVHRWHATPELTDEEVARTTRSRGRASPARATAEAEARPRGAVPAPLVAGVQALLEGDDDAVRATLERTTHEVVFHRLLHIPWLGARRRIEVLVRVATLGFGWQRAVAWRRLAARSDVTEADLARAVHGVRSDDFAEVIAERRLSPEALRVLWERLPSHQHRVVRHPRAPRDLCAARTDFALDAALEASRDEGWLVEMAARVRGTATFMAIVRNPRCPPELVAEVVADPVAYVRSQAAMHPRADGPTLARLAADDDASVRELVAENPATPADVLTAMTGDASHAVRAWVASHASTPLAVLEQLVDDGQARVRRAATTQLSAAKLAEGHAPVAELDDGAPATRRQVARRSRITRTVQERLARDPDVGVRIALAASRGLAREVADVLASDPDARVRRAVALAASTPAELRDRLALDARRSVAEAARHGA